MKNSLSLLFYIAITMNASSSASSPTNTTSKLECTFTRQWHTFIINMINDPITVHIRSKDNSLGNTTLAFKGKKHWEFCMRVGGGTLFSGNFYWKSKTASFTVFDNKLSGKYCKGNNYAKTCLWTVKEDGFYLRGTKEIPNPPKLHDWS
ncbi:hypothetical protein LXL04_009175 [Taraxacum kok-saghyz]